MSGEKKLEFVYAGQCISCKKDFLLADIDGLKLCKDCVDKFDDQLIKEYEQNQFGRDIVNDLKIKQKN